MVRPVVTAKRDTMCATWKEVEVANPRSSRRCFCFNWKLVRRDFLRLSVQTLNPPSAPSTYMVSRYDVILAGW